MRTVADLVRGRGLERFVSMRLSGARDQDVAGGFRQEFAGKATNHCSFQRAASMRAHCQNIGMEHRDLAPYRHVRAAVDQLESRCCGARSQSRQELLGSPVDEFSYPLALSGDDPFGSVARAITQQWGIPCMRSARPPTRARTRLTKR
jgi:hypothetical protein